MLKIELDSVKKVFKVFASGLVSREEALKFKQDYANAVKKIQPSQYCLLVDAREQKPLPPAIMAILETVLQDYIQTPFKKRFVIVQQSAIANNQVTRHAKDKVLEQLIMVASAEEAYKQM